ncbi:alpha/beta hydrolase [Demequina activiva]|uniref:Phospholipase/carboxylesterase n=1 Tax=Demequina activiva TaxID=1582364 RepID=A0A919Q1Z2_9MICO|nr:hypothetical protein [Demequina activiva]GIG54559.1 phospholipase/carboxylesterase [Demequina activiva]
MTSLQSVASAEPAFAPDGTEPVMLLLHGYGSHERDLPGITPLLPRMPWISVRAPLPMAGGGASWFDLSLPDEPRQAGIDEAGGVLWDWIDAEIGDSAPLVPVGFSQGGLMATQLLRTRPQRIAATVVLAGFVSTDEQPADARLALERPPVFWGRGLEDVVIWPAAIERTADTLAHLATLTERTYAGLGHGVNEQMLEDVRDFLDDALRG